MNKKYFFTGVASLVIAAGFALLNLTKIETSLGDTFLATIKIYPTAFFVLLGLVLLFFGLKPLWRD
jgi:hypothetical protein